MVHRHQDKHPPTHKLLAAISRVLELSTQFPDLALDPLLKPIIAAARTRYSLDALLPKVKSMRRILPDTMLRAELLRRGVLHSMRAHLHLTAAAVTLQQAHHTCHSGYWYVNGIKHTA